MATRLMPGGEQAQIPEARELFQGEPATLLNEYPLDEQRGGCSATKGLQPDACPDAEQQPGARPGNRLIHTMRSEKPWLIDTP